MFIIFEDIRIVRIRVLQRLFNISIEDSGPNSYTYIRQLGQMVFRALTLPEACIVIFFDVESVYDSIRVQAKGFLLRMYFFSECSCCLDIAVMCQEL